MVSALIAGGIMTTAGATTYTATWGTGVWTWTDGDTQKTIQVDTTPDGSNVEANISVDFGTLTGNRYSRPAIDDVANGFAGNIDDLGVVFDPDANQGTSPITITIQFNHPMYNTSFIISDIDSRITGGNESTDQVTITTDKGDPTLTLVNPANTTVTNLSGNVASSDTTQDLLSTNDENGSIKVTVPDGAREITIVYEDIYPAADSNTTGRGIGVFGGLTFSTLDTDGDGILDDVDLDDDGDGIPDVIELRGSGMCKYGFLQSFDDKLNILDLESKSYIQIGVQDTAKTYNGIALDNGVLYGIFRENTSFTDAEGNTVDKNDIIWIDQNDGSEHLYADTSGEGFNSYSADAESGKMYILDG